MSVKPGEIVGSYQIVEKIGGGGMASVYRAIDSKLNRTVALKIIHPHLAAQPTFVARFEREAQAVASLRHPHVLPIYSFGEESSRGLLYIVSLFANTGTLSERLEETPLLPLREVVSIVSEIADALQYAHDLAIVHRDIKPSNILCHVTGQKSNNPTLTYYVADFGIARLMESTERLTTTGTGIGTPEYMAPEQSLDDPLDGRADIYAFGIMIFQLLTGQLPFNGRTPLAIAQAHLTQPLPSLVALRPAITAGLAAVVQRATMKRPEDRFTHATELRDAFIAAAQERGYTLADESAILAGGGPLKGDGREVSGGQFATMAADDIATQLIKQRPGSLVERQPGVSGANVSKRQDVPIAPVKLVATTTKDTPPTVYNKQNEAISATTVLPAPPKRRGLFVWGGLFLIALLLIGGLSFTAFSNGFLSGGKTSATTTIRPTSAPVVLLSPSPVVSAPTIASLPTPTANLTWKPHLVFFNSGSGVSCDAASQITFTIGITVFTMVAVDAVPPNTTIDIDWVGPNATISSSYPVSQETNSFCGKFSLFLDPQDTAEIAPGPYTAVLKFNGIKNKSIEFNVTGSP